MTTRLSVLIATLLSTAPLASNDALAFIGDWKVLLAWVANLAGEDPTLPEPPAVKTASAVDPTSCSLSGLVAIFREGERLDPDKRAVVYIESVPSTAFAARPSEKHYMVQKHIQFEPRVMVILKHDLIDFTNKDKIDHSVFSNSSSNPFSFDKSPGGHTGVWPFEFAGPVRIQCDIHKKMRADVLVVSNPFFTMADSKGGWRIEGLPKGKYNVVAWEPNGAKTSFEVRSCAGETKVPPLMLAEAPETRPLKMSGNEYPDYQ